MAVQQMGLGFKSSKKSLSAKAAHFSNANAVYLFSSTFLFFFFTSHSFFPSPASGKEG